MSEREKARTASVKESLGVEKRTNKYLSLLLSPSYLDEKDDDAVEHVPAEVHRLGHPHEKVQHEREAVERDGGDPAPVLLGLALVLAEVIALGDLGGEDGVGGHGREHGADVLAELDVGVVRVRDVLLCVCLIECFCFSRGEVFFC